MVSRLERIRRLKQGAQFAKQHIENADWTNAAVVQQALIEQLIDQGIFALIPIQA